MYNGYEIAEISCEVGKVCELFKGITHLARSIEQSDEDLLGSPVTRRYCSQQY